MSWTVPNILTVLRLLAAMLFPLIYMAFPHPTADAIVLIIFILASLTDWFDGWYARSFNQTSAFGAMLDPIADKAMVAVALLAIVGLYGAHWIVLIPAAAIFIREFAVSGLREALSGRPVNLAVTRLAKWKTAVQMLAIALILLALYMNFAGLSTRCILFCSRPALGWPDLIGVGLLWVAAVMTLITGAQYFQSAMPVLMEEKS